MLSLSVPPRSLSEPLSPRTSSTPEPPRRRSLPICPSRRSCPAPPTNRSSPRAPIRTSAPSPPDPVSFAPPPSIRSGPPPPEMRSASRPPRMTSRPLPPAITSRPRPVAIESSAAAAGDGVVAPTRAGPIGASPQVHVVVAAAGADDVPSVRSDIRSFPPRPTTTCRLPPRLILSAFSVPTTLAFLPAHRGGFLASPPGAAIVPAGRRTRDAAAAAGTARARRTRRSLWITLSARIFRWSSGSARCCCSAGRCWRSPPRSPACFTARSCLSPCSALHSEPGSPPWAPWTSAPTTTRRCS